EDAASAPDETPAAAATTEPMPAAASKARRELFICPHPRKNHRLGIEPRSHAPTYQPSEREARTPRRSCLSRMWSAPWAATSGSHADAELVDVREQVARILVDAIRARGLELFAAVASRQDADAERVGTLGGEHVPHAVADHEALRDRPPKSL